MTFVQVPCTEHFVFRTAEPARFLQLHKHEHVGMETRAPSGHASRRYFRIAGENYTVASIGWKSHRRICWSEQRPHGPSPLRDGFDIPTVERVRIGQRTWIDYMSLHGTASPKEDNLVGGCFWDIPHCAIFVKCNVLLFPGLSSERLARCRLCQKIRYQDIPGYRGWKWHRSHTFSIVLVYILGVFVHGIMWTRGTADCMQMWGPLRLIFRTKSNVGGCTSRTPTSCAVELPSATSFPYSVAGGISLRSNPLNSG